MNILWLSHVIPYPPKTGVLQRSFNLLKETSKIGNVYLLALHKKNVLPMRYDIAEVKQALWDNFANMLPLLLFLENYPSITAAFDDPICELRANSE
ncbi:MAG: hypothetical protein FJ110_13620 [Deltaproteobacteria bacterium]|nr:hypothetical protein [Deltaproteobacteria bacterium]